MPKKVKDKDHIKFRRWFFARLKDLGNGFRAARDLKLSDEERKQTGGLLWYLGFVAGIITFAWLFKIISKLIGGGN